MDIKHDKCGKGRQILTRQIVTRDYRQYKDDEFIKMLMEEVQNVRNFEEKHTNGMAETFVNIITHTLDRIVPLATKFIKDTWISKPWITKNVKNAINNRDRVWSKDWELYRRCRNKVVQEIRVSEREYYENSIDAKQMQIKCGKQ